MMNLWNTYGLDEWTGPYHGQPAQAEYQWVRYPPSNGSGGGNGGGNGGGGTAPDQQLSACNPDGASRQVNTGHCGGGKFRAGEGIRFNNVDLARRHNALG